MNQGVEGRHEEVPSRHPLAALSFGAMLAFVGGRVRRGSIAAGRSATPVVEQAPTVADRRGIFWLLTGEDVGQVGQHDPSELNRPLTDRRDPHYPASTPAQMIRHTPIVPAQQPSTGNDARFTRPKARR